MDSTEKQRQLFKRWMIIPLLGTGSSASTIKRLSDKPASISETYNFGKTAEEEEEITSFQPHQAD
jgi:hypothetical protein